MADENAPSPKSSRMLKTIIIAGVVVLIPAVIALGLYIFLLRPMLGEAPAETVTENGDAIPQGAVIVEFEEERASVLTDYPAEAAPILLYQIGFVCKNEATAAAIDTNRALFRAKLLELHSYRTRSDLNDPYVKQMIQRQAKQEMNSLLGRLAPDQDLEVLEVLHLQYSVYDL